MPWTSITSGMTDANSPLNQVLFDALRNNLDYLKAAAGGIKYVNLRVNQNADAYDAVLDDTMDWRDRYVEVQGNVYQGGTSDIDSLEFGGANDNKINNGYTSPINNARIAKFNDWFYTAAGSAARGTLPRLWQEDMAGDPDCYIWVNSTNGKLMLGIMTSRSSGYKNFVAHLRLIYSEDQGGH